MPPIQSFLYKVTFYYKLRRTRAGLLDQREQALVEGCRQVRRAHRKHQGRGDGLVAPGDSELDKAKKLYAAVEALDNTDYSRQKNRDGDEEAQIKEAKHAEDTWAQKSGTSEDIAMLYLAMLRAAGSPPTQSRWWIAIRGSSIRAI